MECALFLSNCYGVHRTSPYRPLDALQQLVRHPTPSRATIPVLLHDFGVSILILHEYLWTLVLAIAALSAFFLINLYDYSHETYNSIMAFLIFGKNQQETTRILRSETPTKSIGERNIIFFISQTNTRHVVGEGFRVNIGTHWPTLIWKLGLVVSFLSIFLFWVIPAHGITPFFLSTRLNSTKSAPAVQASLCLVRGSMLDGEPLRTGS